MSLKTKLFVLFTCLIGVFSAFAFGLRYLESGEIRDAHERAKYDRAELFRNWQELAGATLKQFANDYTQWDEMAQFVKAPNAEWPVVNIDASTNNFSASAAWVFGVDGKLIYGMTKQLGVPKEQLPWDHSQVMALLVKQPFLHFFCWSGAELLELRVAPVHTSADTERKGVPMGWFFVARTWDEGVLKSLGKLTESRVQIRRPGGLQLMGLEGEAGVVSSQVLKDWKGAEVAILDLDHKSISLSEMEKYDDLQLGLFFGFGGLTLLMFIVFTRFWILNPLGKIHRSLTVGTAVELEALSGEKHEFGLVAKSLCASFQQKAELEHEIERRKRTEEALRESEHGLRDVLEERVRLGRNLHDGVIQSLYAAGMGLSVARSLVQVRPEEAEERMVQCREVLNDTIRDLRAFITGLETEPNGEASFKKAVEALVEHMRSVASFEALLDLDDAVIEALDLTQRANTLHILRESISNALRHGTAKLIAIVISLQSGSVVVSVRDNGCGFNPENPRTGGLGLKNISERAEEMGGELTVSSNPGKGTLVRLTIPLSIQK